MLPRYANTHIESSGTGLWTTRLREQARRLRAAIPAVYQGFAQLHQAALAAGALDAKTKELIALAIAVSIQCDGCIAAHARGVARTGATPQEAAEAIGVAILMSGGPATVYGPRAYAAFQEFHDSHTTRAGDDHHFVILRRFIGSRNFPLRQQPY